tara:strand:- start:101 stop:691 length:591 start_codon:yes stop_codon:yes gene_type:complete
MNKVLPLLIVPPLFLIFFLNVENLTVKLDNKLKIHPVLESGENIVFQNKKDEEIKISNENLSNKNAETKLDDSIKDSKTVLSKSEKSKSENDLKNIQEIKINNKIPEIKPKPSQMLKDNSLKIQFGAFSKLKNAEIQKTKILTLLSTKFPNFERKFGILEENNLFKLIYNADNLSSSEVICDYSKSVKLNCLILKR